MGDDQLAGRTVGAQVSQLKLTALVLRGDTGVNADSHTVFYGQTEEGG